MATTSHHLSYLIGLAFLLAALAASALGLGASPALMPKPSHRTACGADGAPPPCQAPLRLAHSTHLHQVARIQMRTA